MPIPTIYVDRLPDVPPGTVGYAARIALETAGSIRGAARLLNVPLTTYRNILFEPERARRQGTIDRFIEGSRVLPGDFQRPPGYQTWRTSSVLPGAGFTSSALADTPLPTGAASVTFSVRNDEYGKDGGEGWMTAGPYQIGGMGLDEIADLHGWAPEDIGAISVYER